MNTPFFSIVIPLYKKPDTIVETLQSCIAQTYRDFEVIVVDDGSPDNSVEIAQTVADSRIRFIRQENAGVSAARNKGIEEAKGEWILCLDADDCLLPRSLELFAEAIDRYKEYVAFLGFTWISHNQKPSVLEHVAKVTKYYYLNYTFGYILPNAGCAIIKSTLLKETNYDRRMSFYEDQELYLRVMDRGLWGLIPAYMYVHRWDTAELSSFHHPIEKEAAYYFKEKTFKSLPQQLAYFRIVGFCKWARYVEGDQEGLKYYDNLSREKFSFLCRLIYSVFQRYTTLKGKLFKR
ncbi:MAG: glycosyltransferase family 2 protein [Bacteroidales bacterium]|nr:glycosyltransferase family 2 protein [Bacteroidales bacterium]